MMNRGQLESILDELYWHAEHGETKKAVDKMMALQTEALDDAMREIASPTPTATSPFTEGRNECCRLIQRLKERTLA